MIHLHSDVRSLCDAGCGNYVEYVPGVIEPSGEKNNKGQMYCKKIDLACRKNPWPRMFPSLCPTTSFSEDLIKDKNGSHNLEYCLITQIPGAGYFCPFVSPPPLLRTSSKAKMVPIIWNIVLSLYRLRRPYLRFSFSIPEIFSKLSNGGRIFHFRSSATPKMIRTAMVAIA